MNKGIGLLFFLFSMYSCKGQTSDIATFNPAFGKTIDSYLRNTVPLISCDTLSAHLKEYVLLDARETEEYKVSHLPGARHIGYQNFEIENLGDLQKDTPIVLYCSIGYRSEKIGEQLKEHGFSKVRNLYGSIFEWVNQGNVIVDHDGNTTNRLHTYNKKWSKWVEPDSVTKVW